jgi:hypothetical protein
MLKREGFPIAKIYVPVKRRATLNPAVVNEIAESMLEFGQQAPILVRRDGDRFVLVEGLHRLEACKALGEQTILGFLVPAQVEHPKALAPHEAEVEAIRQKTERLRRLRLAKETAERSSAAFTAPTEKATETVIRERPSRLGSMTARSKPETLSGWLAGRELSGIRKGQHITDQGLVTSLLATRPHHVTKINAFLTDGTGGLITDESANVLTARSVRRA